MLTRVKSREKENYMSGINSKRKTDYCGIYKITNKINNKIYIGQSQHCLDR